MTNDTKDCREALLPCPFCGAIPINCMGYDYGKVACDTHGCPAKGNPVYLNKWDARAEQDKAGVDGLAGLRGIQLVRDTANVCRVSLDFGTDNEVEVIADNGEIINHYVHAGCLRDLVRSRPYHTSSVMKTPEGLLNIIPQDAGQNWAKPSLVLQFNTMDAARKALATLDKLLGERP